MPSDFQRSRAIVEAWNRQFARVIAHVDLDAFYSQVEVKNDPERLSGRPVGVVQYNPFGDLATHAPNDDRLFNDSNGSLIAVSYEARDYGVKRNMRGDAARELCAELQLVQVPTAHGKADLTHYRSAGKQVTDILARLSICEKASIDECYLDITAEAMHRLEALGGMPAQPVNLDQVHVCGQEAGSAEAWYSRPAQEWGEGERVLACGAAAVADLRAAVRAELGFSCSAGVAHCKILAKLASGLHKPSQQTVVPAASVSGLLQDLPIPKLRQLGGKFGEDVMQQLNIKTVGELAAVPKARLEAFMSDTQAQWLHELAHGIDADDVKQRVLPKSISCGKTFQGAHTLRDLQSVGRWLKELGQELEERVAVDRAENARVPKLLTVHAGNISRSGPLRRPTMDAIAEDGLALLKKWTSSTQGWSITGMSVCVSNFVAAPTGRSTLSRFFKPSSSPPNKARGTAGTSSRGEQQQSSLLEKPHGTAQPTANTTDPQANELRMGELAAAEPEVKQQHAIVMDREDAAEANAETAQKSAAAAPEAQQPVRDDPHSRAAVDLSDDLRDQDEQRIDPEVWASLPPDIQRELRVQSMAALGSRRPPANTKASTSKRKIQGNSGPSVPKRKPGTIASLFAKRQ